MSNQGYTRRDHRQRKKKSKNSRELLLDKLLKIFFYILVVLVAIILLKIVFFSDDDKQGDKSKNNQVTAGEELADNTSSSATTSSSNTTGNQNTTSDSDSNDDSSDKTSNTDATDNNDATDDTTTETKKEDNNQEETTSREQYIPTGDYTLFDDSAFVGDSRIGGLYLSSQLTTSTFYYDVGGNVSSAVDGNGIELDNGSKGSVIDALKQREFDNIFLQYGVNEWGWNTEGFITGYEKLINEIKVVQPKAKIYVLAIIPVTAQYAEDRAAGAMNVNLKLNEMDEELKNMATRVGVEYINVVEGITGGERVLEKEMSSDGYHLNRIENLKLLDYICEIIK